MSMKKVVIIGNGNWATAIAILIANNIKKYNKEHLYDDKNNLFEENVILRVHEEIYENQNLSDYINKYKTNPIYLPIKLPDNILAVTDMSSANEADFLIICVPHEFIEIIKDIKPKKGAIAINLSKGLISQNGSLMMPSEYIEKLLGIDCCCLQGANIANEVAESKLAECTIGYVKENQIEWLKRLFCNDNFICNFKPFNKGIEVAGALKNIVSLAVGIAHGLNLGSNAKAMIFRQGLIELKEFCKIINADFCMLENCCIADLFSSCVAGRNYKCGIQMGESKVTYCNVESGMCGQKLQGPSTAKAINDWFTAKKQPMENFPLIETIYKICFCEQPFHSIIKAITKNK